MASLAQTATPGNRPNNNSPSPRHPLEGRGIMGEVRPDEVNREPRQTRERIFNHKDTKTPSF